MKHIVIDAEELIAALQTHPEDESEYLLDLETGDVIFHGDPFAVGEDEVLESMLEESPARFLVIEPISSDIGWEIMASFIEEIPPGDARENLTRSVQHSHPFRRFKDTLQYHPDLREKWFAFEYAAILIHAERWIEDEGLDAELKTRVRIEK